MVGIQPLFGRMWFVEGVNNENAVVAMPIVE
jgi:hypothetical protein